MQIETNEITAPVIEINHIYKMISIVCGVSFPYFLEWESESNNVEFQETVMKGFQKQ